MSLVLAIQPDSTQAARLTSVCRRIGTELVLAPSAVEALAVLGERIPDVILSAPLLPASDEAAIAERLRAMGEDALHVQTLGAPILGAPIVHTEPGGLLEALRRRRPATAPAVCDPLAFAGELSAHLLRAVAERAAITGVRIEAPSLDIVAGPVDPRGAGANPETDTTTDHNQPVDIDLTPLLETIEEKAPLRSRKGRPSRRRKPRLSDDAAYFDPDRCTFAAVREAFDEFVHQRTRRA
jgi:CheY-like chemotaxis protein